MGDFTIGTKAVLSQSGSDEAVLSGDVNLGSATFPAGHTINTITTSPISGVGSTTTDTSAWQASGVSIDVTASQYAGGSKIVVYASVATGFSGTQVRYKLERSAPSTVTLNAYYETLGVSSGGSWNRMSFTMFGADTSLGSGTHTYRVICQPADGTMFYNGISSNDKFNIIAYVIK